MWLATHHLECEAYQWWINIRDDPDTDMAAMSWIKFKELLSLTYFSPKCQTTNGTRLVQFTSRG